MHSDMVAHSAIPAGPAYFRAAQRLSTPMSFPERLVEARHAANMTQTQLAKASGISLSQVKKYEGGDTGPSLIAIRKLCLALQITSDQLVFDNVGQSDDDALRLAFGAMRRFDPEDKAVATKLLQALILQHQAKVWSKAS